MSDDSRMAPAYIRAFHAWRGRVEFGDGLALLYIVAFVREYLWALDSNALAWALTIPLAALGWLGYVSTKPFLAEKVGAPFWLIVGLPLLFVYALRVSFPDLSFDVLNYRLFHAERALRGPLLAPGDFFPTPAPYNPAPDIVTGLARLALGYRLGTIVNLWAMLWIARVCDSLLRPCVRRAWPRAGAVLLIVLAEHMLFEINNYMIDLLALPLMLEATRLALRADEAEDRRALFIHVALLLGAATALKLTNAVLIAPVIVLCAYRALAGRRRLALRDAALVTALSLAAFLASNLPYAAHLYQRTGNPLFPFANGFFRSPFWPTNGGWDGRWGPVGAWQTVAWPFLIFFDPARHSELGVYSGRLGLGFAAALCGSLVFVRRDARAFVLCAVTVAGCLLWSAAGMGYARYALYLEALAGVVVITLVSAIASSGATRAAATGRRLVAALVCALLVAQAALAARYVARYEWSMRPTAISNFRAYAAESKFLLRDRSLASFLSPEEREVFGGVGLWVESDAKSNGFEALLNPTAPAIAARHHEFFTTRDARLSFIHALGAAPGRRAYSLAFPGGLAAAREAIESRALRVESVTPISLPFFSTQGRVGMMLLEISVPEPSEGSRLLESLRGPALSDDDYRARLTLATPLADMKAGTKTTLRFRVANLGDSPWPARGDANGRFLVTIGDQWLDEDGRRVINNMDGRTALSDDLAPGAEVELPLTITAPREPGDYTLEVDMIHEGVTFFHEKGSQTLRLRARVTP